MSEDSVREQVRELALTLEELEAELREQESGRSTLSQLVRFTREVTIPAVILVLRTNIEALKLLQRTLRFVGEDDRESASGRAERAGRAVLSEVEDALAEVGEAVAGEPTDDRARELLEEARSLRAEVEAELEDGPDEESVGIDVESELRSIKDDIDEDERVDGR